MNLAASSVARLRRSASALVMHPTRMALVTLALTPLPVLAFASTASAGYGPSGLQPSEAPGGYTGIVTAKTISTGGATLAGSVGGTKVTITVPAGAFTQPIQLRVLKPHKVSLLSALRKSGFKHGKLLAGVGVAASYASGEGDSTLPGSVSLSLKIPHLPKHFVVLAYNAKLGRYGKVAYHLKHGVITVKITKPVALAVLSD